MGEFMLTCSHGGSVTPSFATRSLITLRVCLTEPEVFNGKFEQYLEMADRPPPGFLEIIEADRKNDQQLYNVIGLCADYLEPAQSRGTDITMKMQLWDATCLNSPELRSDGMGLRCFYKEKGLFPPVQEVGDVVIARNIKTLSKGSQRFAVSSYATTWSVISGSSLSYNTDSEFRGVEVRGPHALPKQSRPSLAELKYAKALVEAKDPSTLRGPPKSTALDVATIMTESGGRPPPTRTKYRMLKDIRSPRDVPGLQFVDLIGEIRRVYSGFVNPVEMQLTDYTEHPQLYNYLESDGTSMQNNTWVGPSGKMTITINAWDQHGEYIMNKVRNAEIDLGTYVRVSNVQIKMDKLGTLMQGHLRGGNGNAGTSITVHSSKDAEHIPELKELIARKRDNNIARKSKAIGFVQEESTKKRARDDDQEEPTGKEKKKKKSKSALQREKRRLEKAKVNGETACSDGTTAPKSKVQPNQHVRCEAVSIPFTSISSILEGEYLERVTPAGNPHRLPFQNCKYKSKVQVVDFFPDSLEDFATPYRTSDYEALSDYDSVDDEDASIDYARRNTENVKWKWHFFIVVQDPTIVPKRKEKSSTMLLQVAGQDGDYLLNMEACDLNEQNQELAKLKEKLFVLWGDLQEKKAETGKSGLDLAGEDVTISSKPFECLIKEYGVKAVSRDGTTLESDWERMFRIFGTNIG